MKNKNAFKRIFDRGGASTLIALLIFFIAALSGTVALTMAASNAGRYTHEKEDQQAYLSVVSAANLIVETLDNFDDVFFRTKDASEPSWVTSETNVQVSYRKNESDISLNQLFLGDQRFKSNLIARSMSISLPYQDIPFRLSMANDPEVGSVYVTLVMSNSSLLFRLWSENGEAKDYQMTVSIPINT